jgi:hypothetical protein
MQTLEVTTKNALNAHRNADEKGKKMLADLFGQDVFNMKITDRVKTFMDALDIVGASDNQKILLDYNGIDPEMIAAQAFLKVTIIAKALNEGWKPNWDNDSEYKYYPWFKLSGSGLSCNVYVDDSSASAVGSRLCFRTRELAEYAGKQFTDLYKEYMIIS